MAAQREGRDGNVFLKSAINVVVGAFRLTTDVLSKSRSRREGGYPPGNRDGGHSRYRPRGKQGGAKEIVCLLEGKIEVTRDPVAGQSTAPVVLDQPLQFYIAPRGEPTLPIGLRARRPTGPVGRRDRHCAGHGWRQCGRTLESALIPTPRLPVPWRCTRICATRVTPRNSSPEKKAGKRTYVVQLSNLSSEGDARAMASRLGQGARAMASVGR